MATPATAERWQLRTAASISRIRSERTWANRLRTARLKEECADLMIIAEKLERLATDLHKARTAHDAQVLAEGLQTGLSCHLEAEAAMLQHLAVGEDDILDQTIERARAEHLALRQLVIPVIQGLGAISQNRLPKRVSRFVLETTVLCAFIRLHVDFKRRKLYPLVASMDGRKRIRDSATMLGSAGLN